MSECPTGCGRRLDTQKLLCSKCWSRVPGDLQKRVYSTWNKYRRFTGLAQSDERRQARLDYQGARDAAITAAGL
jgi:hypothetical protein